MNRSKRTLCAVLACMMLYSFADAESDMAEITAAPVSEATVAPEEKPAADPTSPQTTEPTKAETEAPATEQTQESTAAPTDEPIEVPTNEPIVAPTTEPTAEPTEEPTIEPTVEPTGEPTIEPTEEPTVESTTEPTTEPTVEPTMEPTEEPAEEPTIEPTVEPTADPTIEPTTEPTVEPTVEPTIEPTIPPAGAISISISGNVQVQDNVWQISLQNPEEQIVFRWTPLEAANLYLVRIVDGQGAEIYSSSLEGTSVSISASALGSGTHTMTVQAYQKPAQEESEQLLIAQDSIAFAVSQGMFGPGGMPGGGGRPGGAGMAGGAPEEQGFHVTPGEALTSKHSSGTKDMQAYGTVQITETTEVMTVLILDDTELSVFLDEQNAGFTVKQEENILILTPESAASTWSVNAFALKTLNRSGVDTIRLEFAGKYVDISTSWQLQGDVYGKLSAAGYVSKDYDLLVTGEEILVSVDDKIYQIDENNELFGG